MATVYTRRFIIVVRPALAAKANEAAKLVDTPGGERAFTVPLRLAGDATNVIRAYWCGWTLTVAEAQAIRDRLVEKGATTAETVVVTAADKPTFVPVPSARVYVFDARPAGWAPAEVLAVLGLDTLATSIVTQGGT